MPHWSALIMGMGNGSEPAVFRAASPMVLASIEYTKLYIWLVMHATPYGVSGASAPRSMC